MRDYRAQAESYVSALNSGSILPGSEQFTELLKFLKSFRKHRNENPDSAPLYRSLVGLSRRRLFAEIVQPLSGKFRMIGKGEAHLLAGLLQQQDGRSWFVKTVSAAAAEEFDAVHALLDGRLPRSGRHFAFMTPDTVILNAGLVTYIGPAIPDPPPLEQDFRRQGNDVPAILRGLAEMNVALGCFARAACPLPLRQQEGGLADISRARLRAHFPEAGPEALDEICRRFKEIRALWPRFERRFDETKWGLAHGDLASNNATIQEGRLLYLDLGKTGFGPLGSDLYWLLYKNRANPEDQRQILSAYCRELRDRDIAVTEEEVHVNALRRYAQKWLFPSRRGTMVSLDHIRDTQAAVLALLHAQGPSAS